MKALFINGSPRKNGNTAKLLKRAMEGAAEAGAETELINLYDRSLNFKGCMSCFDCKMKGGKTSTRPMNSAKDCVRRVNFLSGKTYVGLSKMCKRAFCNSEYFL